ncbi:hypothetical protein LTR65_005750 [Meristemomyces frigidus]
MAMAQYGLRPMAGFQHSVHPQKRTFLGLRRPPPPRNAMMGYLVAQGLAIVLLVDLAIASVQNEPTTIRSVCQSAGFWKEKGFGRLHDADGTVKKGL